MSGERSSTVRRVRAGKICAICQRILSEPALPGEQLCENCRAKSRRHRVYLSFMLRDGWHCQFLEQDLTSILPRKLHFKSAEKVRELAERGGCNMNLEARQALDHGIEIGRGGIWLELSEEQYQTISKPH